MDNYLFISAVIIFVEKRMKGKVDYKELEESTGFSLPYIRELFALKMDKSLYRYILERRVANAAFECSHTDKPLLTLGMEYGFNNADAFTRAFKRIIGITPSEFRRKRIMTERVKLCAGVYGIGLPILENRTNEKGKKKNAEKSK